MKVKINKQTINKSTNHTNLKLIKLIMLKSNKNKLYKIIYKLITH